MSDEDEPVVQYHIYSKYDDKETPVGTSMCLATRRIDNLGSNNFRMPIEVGSSVFNNWYSTPAQITSGSAHLGGGSFQYTTEVGGNVFVTTDPAADKEWFLLPANEKDTYTIGIDEAATSVWTMTCAVPSTGIDEVVTSLWNMTSGTIQILPFVPGESNQVFKIVRI